MCLIQLDRFRPVEDDLVELKRDWPQGFKCARRIAAHANQVHGAEIVWIIGVDETVQGVPGIQIQVDPADWWSQVRKHFVDGVEPDLVHVMVGYENRTVAALAFTTDRAPYLVANPAFGKEAGVVASREVPWREGTATRTATRNQLLTVLAGAARVPYLELVEAELSSRRGFNNDRSVQVMLHVLVDLATWPVTLLEHRSVVIVTNEAQGLAETLEDVTLRRAMTERSGEKIRPYSERDPRGTRLESSGALTLHTADVVSIEASGSMKEQAATSLLAHELTITLQLGVASLTRTITLRTTLSRTNDMNENVWRRTCAPS